MKIDKKTVDMFLKMNDEQLWQAIRMIAASNGANNVPAKKPDNFDVSLIRKILSNLNEEDILKATDIIEQFKKSK